MGKQQRGKSNTVPQRYVVALCLAQVCACPPPAIRVWPFFEGGVCRQVVGGVRRVCVCVGGGQVFAIIGALRGTKCG